MTFLCHFYLGYDFDYKKYGIQQFTYLSCFVLALVSSMLWDTKVLIVSRLSGYDTLRFLILNTLCVKSMLFKVLGACCFTLSWNTRGRKGQWRKKRKFALKVLIEHQRLTITTSIHWLVSGQTPCLPRSHTDNTSCHN